MDKHPRKWVFLNWDMPPPLPPPSKMVHDKGTSRGKDTARSKGAAKRTKSTVNRSKSAAREAQPPTTFSLDLRPEFMNLKIVHETRITRSDFVELEWFKGIMNEVAEMDKKVNYCNAVGTKGWKDENSATNENTKLAYGAVVETMTSCSQLQNHLPAALTATRDHDVNVHRVSHSFPSVLSYTETLPLVGHVSHVAVPESRSDYLESSCERSSTPSTVQNVHISARLMEEFMELARANTNNNMETCGVLGAYLKDRTFYVTTLIVPKQESTSNSCQALNEEEIYTIHDEQSLFPVGWIHACTNSSPNTGSLQGDAPAWCLGPFEPEGLLSSVSAILSGTIGVHYGHVLIHVKAHSERLMHWLLMAFGLLIFSIILHFTNAIPLNK